MWVLANECNAGFGETRRNCAPRPPALGTMCAADEGIITDMKLECLQENLAEGLTVVGRVVPTKSTLPVLSNVLLSTRNGELQLTANNLELSVAHRVPAAIAREGEITLPSRLLSDYVALLDHGQKVELDLNPKTHKVHLA